MAAHLAGGALLALGLITRTAAIVQIPALIGAVFFVHLREGLFRTGQSLELSSLVLFLLCVFAVFGGGRLSLDHYAFGNGVFRADVGRWRSSWRRTRAHA
jgi:putative oxidoreductase